MPMDDALESIRLQIQARNEMTPVMPYHTRLTFGLTMVLLLCAATVQAQPDTQGTPRTGKDVQSGDKGRQADARGGDMMGGMK